MGEGEKPEKLGRGGKPEKWAQAEGRETPGTCPRRPQEAPVQTPPPWTLPGSRPGEKNGSAGLSVQKGAPCLPRRTGKTGKEA